MASLKSTIAALVVAMACSAPASAHDGVHIDGAYARFLPGAKSGAVFMVIENHSTAEERLISVTTDVAEKAELHTSKIGADGMAQMPLIDGGIALRGGESHVLERGGDHLMIMGLTRKVVSGDVITLTLTFEHAGVVVVEVPVDNAR